MLINSGTRKTYTMEGTVENRGVNYRTLEELFKVVGDRKDLFDYDISVSFLEVYNEQIRDLLPLSPSSNKLELKAAAWFHHAPILEAKVHNLGDVWTVLDDGKNARAVGSTNLNEHSSRSHCMLCIIVKTVNLVTREVTQSKLWLCYLAGSERFAKSDAQGERLKEAQHINRPFSALGDVMFALSSKRSHVPYRNSKLTYLLQDSLGGSAKTIMFVQISHSETDLTETLSSLNFASRVSEISLGHAKKLVDKSRDCRASHGKTKMLDQKLKAREPSCSSKVKEHKILKFIAQQKAKVPEQKLKAREPSCSANDQGTLRRLKSTKYQNL
ncbi:Kinesin-4 [Platanthera zijinensis]|uniref:Kinesin-4 n=1 Tax=Platanthera zijinensis TaxID=2320716 RepID=A0AAP0FZW7_9ASPA